MQGNQVGYNSCKSGQHDQARVLQHSSRSYRFSIGSPSPCHSAGSRQGMQGEHVGRSTGKKTVVAIIFLENTRESPAITTNTGATFS